MIFFSFFFFFAKDNIYSIERDPRRITRKDTALKQAMATEKV